MALWSMAWARRSFKSWRLGEPYSRIAEIRAGRSLFEMGARRAVGEEGEDIRDGVGWPPTSVMRAKPV